MLDKLTKQQQKAEAELAKITAKQHTAAQIEDWIKNHTGRKSELANILREVKDLPSEQRAEAGRLANEIRIQLESQGNELLTNLLQAELDAKLKSEFMDLTVPGIAPNTKGGLHPITIERLRVEEIFKQMGFAVHDPYLVDTDYNNFTAVNIPEGHPARDMWDTLRVSDNLSLIVHTSSMQNRVISGSEAPIRAIVPGKTFRREATDARHEHSFFQVEGVYVDRGIKLSDMIGTLKQFLSYYFGKEMKIKIQPTYFPFVEPGLEVMMECPVCNGKKPKNCAGCGGFGWMEVIPCGPIHPFVIKEAGLDPNSYSGFAWGFGLDRLIMIKNAIDDVRTFHTGRIDFIQQFN